MALDNFKAAITTLIFVAIVVAALALALNAFRDDLSTTQSCAESWASYNTTTNSCHNTTDSSQVSGTTITWNVTTEGLQGTSNAASYLSTIGTLIGVSALIGIVVAAFMFVRR